MARRGQSAREAMRIRPGDPLGTSPLARYLQPVLRTRTLNSLLVFSSLAVGTALLTMMTRVIQRPDLTQPALAAIPAGAQLIASVDLRRLRTTPFARVLSGKSRALLQPAGDGSNELTRLCGFDPLDLAQDLALAVPPSPTDGELAVAATGPFSAASLTTCASRIVTAREGRPVTLREGDFLVVTDVSASSAEVVAVRDGGPLLLGSASYVRQMMATAERRAPSAQTDARHVALRSEVGERQPLVLSALLTADGRDRVRAELGDPGAAAASVIGLSLSASAGDPVALHGMIGCDQGEPCAQLARSLDALRKSDEGELGKQLLGLKEPLDAATIAAEGPTVHAHLQVPQATVLRLLETLMPGRN